MGSVLPATSPPATNSSSSSSSIPKSSTANSGHFTTTANGMFPDANSPSTSASDYANWGWKEIEAAIVGGSELIGQDAMSRALSISNPQTLWDAADTFETVRLVLEAVGNALNDQAAALAHGSDAPWQGDAADAFFKSVSLFAAQVLANFKALNGGDTESNGSNGQPVPSAHNVPQQLFAAGNQLDWARKTVQEIDTFYASVASQLNAPTGSGNLVHVSAFPAIANAMRDDMLTFALLPLAAKYQVFIDSVQPPNPASFGVGNPNGGFGQPNSPGSFNFHFPQFNFPNSQPNSPGAFNFHLPQFNFPNSQPNSPGAFNFHPPQFNTPNSPQSPAGANSPLGSNFQVPPFRQVVSPGPNSPGFGANSQGPQLRALARFSPNSPAAAGRSGPAPLSALSPPAFRPTSTAPALAGLAASPNSPLNGPLQTVPGLKAFSPGANSPLANRLVSPQGASNVPLTALPNVPLSNRQPSPAAGLANLPLLNRAASPPAARPNLTSQAPGGVPLSAGGAQIPFLPLTGAGQGANGLNGGGLPSRLLGGRKAFSPNAVPALHEVGTNGALPGGASLAGLGNKKLVSPLAAVPNLTSQAPGGVPLSAGGAQIPFLPFLPGAGQGANGANGAGLPSPTDASGLLGGRKAFSPNAAPAFDEVGTNGALPGGASLAGLGGARRAVSPLAGVPNLASAGAGIPPVSATGQPGTGQPGGASTPFFPFLPGAGQGNAAPGAGAPEPTDASGLLGGQRAFSPNGAPLIDEVGANGALPGGAALSGLGGTRRAVSLLAGTPNLQASGPGIVPEPGVPGQGVPGAGLPPYGGAENQAVSGAGPGQPGGTSAPFFPFLPGMGQAGGAGRDGGAEPTDASGLLGGAILPWAGDDPPSDEIGGPGTRPGGAGLGERPRAAAGPGPGLHPGAERETAGPGLPGAGFRDGTAGGVPPGEGAMPGQGALPGERAMPDERARPGQGVPGQGAASGPGAAPGGATVPGEASFWPVVPFGVPGPGAGGAMEKAEPAGHRGADREDQPADPAARTGHAGPGHQELVDDVAAWGAGAGAAWILTGSGGGPGEVPHPGRADGFPPDGDDPPAAPAGGEAEADWAGTGLVGWRPASRGSGAGGGEDPDGHHRLRATSAPYEGEEVLIPAPDEDDDEEDEEDRIGNLLIEESTLWGLPVDDLGDLE